MDKRKQLLDSIETADAQDIPNLILELGNIGSKSDVPFLLSRLQSDNKYIRDASAQALAEIGGDEAYQALLNALDEPDVPTKSSIINSIGKMKREEAIPVLSELQLDQNTQLAEAASGALWTIGTPSALSAREIWLKRAKEMGYYGDGGS